MFRLQIIKLIQITNDPWFEVDENKFDFRIRTSSAPSAPPQKKKESFLPRYQVRRFIRTTLVRPRSMVTSLRFLSSSLLLTYFCALVLSLRKYCFLLDELTRFKSLFLFVCTRVRRSNTNQTGWNLRAAGRTNTSKTFHFRKSNSKHFSHKYKINFFIASTTRSLKSQNLILAGSELPRDPGRTQTKSFGAPAVEQIKFRIA